MKKSRPFVCLCLVLLMLLSLAACGEQEQVPSDSPEPTPSYEPVSYVLGSRSHTLNAMPQKVLTAGPNCTEMLCALGLSDRVVGKCMTNHSLGVLEDCREGWDKIPTLCEGYPTLEEIKASGCDFIYASSWIFTGGLTVEALEAAGIDVYINDAHNLRELWVEISDMGRIFHVQDKAAELVAAEKARIAAVKEALSDCDELKILVVDSVIGKKVLTAGGSNIETEYIEAAGCENVFDSLSKPWDGVSARDIIAADPDFIIIHDYLGSDVDSTLSAFMELDGIAELDCVVKGNFIVYSLENVMPGMRSALTVEQIAQTVFQDAFPKAEDQNV